jgi:hypothetical protein
MVFISTFLCSVHYQHHLAISANATGHQGVIENCKTAGDKQAKIEYSVLQCGILVFDST